MHTACNSNFWAELLSDLTFFCSGERSTMLRESLLSKQRWNASENSGTTYDMNNIAKLFFLHCVWLTLLF